MTHQELVLRWRMDRLVRGIIYLLTGFALVFLVQGGIVGIFLAVCLAWVVLKFGPR